MFFNTKKDKHSYDYNEEHNDSNGWRQYMYIILAIIILIIIILLIVYFYNSNTTPVVVPNIKHRYIPLKE